MATVTEQKSDAVEVDRVELEDGGYVQLMNDGSFNFRGIKQIHFIEAVHKTYAKLHESEDIAGFFDIFKKLHEIHGDNGVLYGIVLFGMEDFMKKVYKPKPSNFGELLAELMNSTDGEE